MNKTSKLLWAALLAVGIVTASLQAATTETHTGAVNLTPGTIEADTKPGPFARGWDNVKGWTEPESGELFRAGEAHLDLAGLYTAAQPRGIENIFKTNARHGPFGAGAGVSYFPSLYLGFGAELASYDLRDPGPILIDSLAINAILRVPLGRVAPNITVGVGRDFDGGRYFFQGGPGFEIRVNRGIALFADAKFQFKEQDGGDQLVTRAGLRFVF